MQKIMVFALAVFSMIALVQCSEKKPEEVAAPDEGTSAKEMYDGFESQVKWGEHLVLVGACHDCHTPKKMTARGPVLDTALWLSGHPAQMPRIDVNRKEIESKGLAVTMDLTEWVGAWGVSFTANLTPDETGIGNWTEEQFIRALREGKFKGLANARPLLPPMPWEMYRNLTDDEIKAIFAYLKSIKPVSNLVPAPIPPTSAGG
jgi:mono/diheme cytochrome c family protein